MPLIMTHSMMVQPIPRLSLQCSIIFSGEIETLLDDPTLTTNIEQEEFTTTVEECDVIETSLEQDELVVVVEEDTV